MNMRINAFRVRRAHTSTQTLYSCMRAQVESTKPNGKRCQAEQKHELEHETAALHRRTAAKLKVIS